MNSLIVKDQGIKISLSWHNLKLPEFKDSSVNKSIIKLNSGEHYIVWHWHYTNGKHVNKGVDARLNNLVGILKLNRQFLILLLETYTITGNDRTKIIVIIYTR